MLVHGSAPVACTIRLLRHESLDIGPADLSPVGRQGSRERTRLCAAPAWGAAGALTDTSQTWRAPAYSARRPRGCNTNRSLAGSPETVSARVAFTATTAAALRVNATCTAWPSRLCDAMRQPGGACAPRVNAPWVEEQGVPGELSTELIPGDVSHMRGSDHEAAPAL